MKKLFFIINLSFHSLNSFTQINYNAEVKKFIDYDTSVIVFQHALLIDGTGNIPRSNQTIIVKNGKIDWVGDDAKAIVPTDAQKIDLTGKALMPGLVMLHEHMFIAVPVPGNVFVKQLPISFPRLYLAAGVTTTRTAGSNDPYFDLGIKRDIEAGRLTGPSMFLTAPPMQGKEGSIAQMQRVVTIENAVNSVNYWADQGFTSFKAYMTLEKNILKAAIEAAHKKGLKLTGHLCAVTYREAAELGIDHLEHGFFACADFVKGKKENECPSGAARSNSFISVNDDSLKSLIRFLVNKKISMTSTLAVFEGNTSTQPSPDTALLEWVSADQRELYLQRLATIKSSTAPAQYDFDKAFGIASKMEKFFYDAGGLLTVGTDPTINGGIVAGFSTWRAIELLVQAAGFTPLEAIKIASLNGAKALGMDKLIGTIQAGKEADLIVIDGDPSKNISDIRKVIWVFKDGVGFNSKRMFESVKGKVGFY